ncbi:MAG: SNF2 helicase-associated domain-containing protein, partial [Luteitalea sp.]
MSLVYQPDIASFFLRDHRPQHPAWASHEQRGRPRQASLVLPAGVRVVDGVALPFRATITDLAALPDDVLPGLPPTLAIWSLASRLALDLVIRGRVVPGVHDAGPGIQAIWLAALAAPDDAARASAIAQSMPPAAHAVPVSHGHARDVWAADALLRHFLDAAIDAFMRAAHDDGTRVHRPLRHGGRLDAPWPQRWHQALTGPDRRVEPDALTAGRMIDGIAAWNAPARGLPGRLRACFQLDLPHDHDDASADADGRRSRFRLHYLLQSPDDPTLTLSAAEAWQTRGRRLERFGEQFDDPQDSLLEALGRASRLFAPIADSLHASTPDGVDLSPAQAWTFIDQAAPAMTEAGFTVQVPERFAATGAGRLRLRMRVGDAAAVDSGDAPGASLDALVEVGWDAMIGDTVLPAADVAGLTRQKAALVRHRGAWVVVDPHDLPAIRATLAAGGSPMPLRQALHAALAVETRHGTLVVPVVAEGGLAALLERVRQGPGADVAPPQALQATLRPYQVRGLAWLTTLAAVGLGACLADDMGLGKTLEALALFI